MKKRIVNELTKKGIVKVKIFSVKNKGRFFQRTKRRTIFVLAIEGGTFRIRIHRKGNVVDDWVKIVDDVFIDELYLSMKRSLRFLDFPSLIEENIM